METVYKRALSLVIAFAIIFGTVFATNNSININVNAESEQSNSAGKTIYLQSTNSNNISNIKLSDFTIDKHGNYVIDTAEKLAFVCTYISAEESYGKTFKVAEDIDAFVLQTQDYASGIKDLTNATDVKTYFESNTTNRYNWMSTNTGRGVFNGTFDGNGVIIYGVYAEAGGKQNSTGLFPMVDGGGPIGTSGTPSTDTTNGTTIKNFALRNSYFTGYAHFGAVIANTYGAGGAGYVNGHINVVGCELSSCYLYVNDQLASATGNKAGTYVTGVFSGFTTGDPIKLSDCLIYGNRADTNVYNSSDGSYTFTENGLTRLFGNNKYNSSSAIYGELKSCVIDARIYGTNNNNSLNSAQDFVSNVYTNTDQTAQYPYTINVSNFKGSAGKSYMPTLNWATDETAGNGTVQWYARENDVPTPIMPIGWQDTVKEVSFWNGPSVDYASISYDSGTGTKADPFIISTADQLWKMVKEGGCSKTYGQVIGQDSNYANYDPYYYKVADGVDAIYLNDVFDDPTYKGIMAIVNAGNAKNWRTTNWFYGNFDGNGVTIYGLYSETSDKGVGFVYGLDGSDAAIKNVNFKACQIRNSGTTTEARAAMVTTNVRDCKYDYTDGNGSTATFDHKANITIANVSVSDSSVRAYDNSDASAVTFDTLASAGGIISIAQTPDILTISNCLFDGTTATVMTAAKYDYNKHSIAGIVSFGAQCNNINIQNCVSINIPLVPMVTTTANNGSYLCYTDSSDVIIRNSYGVNNSAVTNNAAYTVIAGNITNITGKTSFAEADLRYIDLVNQWQLVNGKPMPKVAPTAPDLDIYVDYTSFLSSYNGLGLNGDKYPYLNGNYGWYSELVGSGTKVDPYIIDSAQKLAIAIATGGKNLDDKLYYKLACDINLGALPWIETNIELNNRGYKYTPFEGVLDGDGHTVTGLSAIDKDYSGLVPVLEGGTVKNIHLRNSYSAAGKDANVAGVIVGQINNKVAGGNLSGCSVEGSRVTAEETSTIVGTGWINKNIKNSYLIYEDLSYALYFLNAGDYKEFKTGTVGSADAQAILADSDNWYLGGAESSVPRLKNYAVAHTIADVDGDGSTEDYTPNDLFTLRKKLLYDVNFANAYGDVNSNGITSVSDLAVLRREMIGTYDNIKDGFWRNVELGKVKIYYYENDTQDMARKMELYLESVYPLVDIVKVPGISVTDTSIPDDEKENYNNQQNAIVIRKDSKISDTDYGKYSVTYDKANNVLNIKGGSFTAVEQAVYDFIEQSDANTATVVPEGGIYSQIAEYKERKTVELAGDNTSVNVYYAWGDEFGVDNTAASNCTHSYNGVVEQEAELFKAGIKRYTCSLCGDNYTETFPLESIKLLSIGNSYSINSLNQVYSLCKKAGVKNVDIAIVYSAGRPVREHYYNIIDPENYTLLDDGTNTGTGSKRASHILRNNNGTWEEFGQDTYAIDKLLDEGGWDVISLQGSPAGAGGKGTQNDTTGEKDFYALGPMVDYISEKCPNSEIMWFMTWANEEDTAVTQLFNNDEEYMYSEIARCVNDYVLPNDKIDHVVPVGTAVINARTSKLRDYVLRDDGSHLNNGVGYCLGGLTWFSYLTGVSVDDIDLTYDYFDLNNIAPTLDNNKDQATAEEITIIKENLEIIKESVRNAINKPYKATQSTNPTKTIKSTKSTTIDKNNWLIEPNKTEGIEFNNKTESEALGTSYLNIEAPNVDNLKDLWVINDGKLSIWRGVNTDVSTDSEGAYSWGYKGVAAGEAGTTNDFGSVIDSSDKYIDPGLVTTKQSMLFKQGYAEMRASLPSDGHAFPAWWFMNGVSLSKNSQINNSLYNKVYKRNTNMYDGSTDLFDVTKPSTYKYQLPMAHLEFNAIQLLQESVSDTNSTTGTYNDSLQFTVHKHFSGVNSDASKLYLYDWSKNKYLNKNGVAQNTIVGIAREEFGSTSSDTNLFTHQYNSEKIYSAFAYNNGSKASFSIEAAKSGGLLGDSATIQDYYTYGFYWSVDEASKKYYINIYIDANDNGSMEWDELIFQIDQTMGHEDGVSDPIFGKDAEYDAWNQYAFMLLNNSFYTSNKEADTGVKLYTDLLQQDENNGTAGAADKTTFDIEYVRVYQQNGRRDIITPETEAFNTNDHFGYGDNDMSTQPDGDSETIPSNEYTSITDVVVNGNNVFAADKTGQKVYKLSSDGSIESTYSVGTQVNGVYATDDEVYVLAGAAQGKVVVLDSKFKKTTEISVGHTPSAMIISDEKAYVANRFDNNISVIDLSKNKETAVIDINGREAIDMTLAGDKIYVACHLPENASTDDVISANVAVIDTVTDTQINTIELVNGAGGVKGIASSPDGKNVYVTHIVARYGYPTTQLDRGWINTNGFSVINTENDTAVAMLLDEVDLGAANPWGVDISEDGSKVVFTISGTDEVMIVDTAKMNEKINAVKNGNGVVKNVGEIVNYLPFLDDCRTRIQLSGKGARAIDIKGNTAYIGQYFTGDIEKLSLETLTLTNFKFVEQPENDKVRTGEILFADANKCYQKWQSCLSCHPDALADGLNWDNMNDGLGNPKSAKSMLYAHRTPPTMSTGIRDSAEVAVHAGMKFIQFNVLPEDDLVCIDEYLKSLQPEQSPYLNTDGTLTESALRGKELFESEGCATCHPAPLYTDLKLHNSKITEITSSWENRQMDTPTLVEVWRTGPWGFDGRFSSMEDAVRFYVNNDSLTNQDITDLANFVLSIGDEGEQYGVEQVFVTADGKQSSGKLIAGGKIDSFTVRRQHSDSEENIIVTATLTAANGQVIKSQKIEIKDMKFNTAKTINLSGFDIPENGATLKIIISNSEGDYIASPYTLIQ